MAFTRARTLRTLQSSLRQSTRRPLPAFTRTTQLVQRRYASEGGSGGHAHEDSSDIPWAIGAVAVTAPACWYLWPDLSHADAGHHGDHDEHAEGGEVEEKDEESKEDGGEEGGEQEASGEGGEEQEGGEEGEDKQEAGEQEGEKEEGNEQGSGDEKQGKQEGGDKPEGGEEKESSDEGSKGEQKAQGEDKQGSEDKDDSEESDSSSEEESPDQAGEEATKAESEGATSKNDNPPPKESGKKQKHVTSGSGKDLFADNTQGGDESSQKSKGKSSQFGISTGATKHSTDISKDPNKSKKGDGSPETAKAKGTVKPGS